MITVFEKTNQLNIIHCIMGDPTDMQMDFVGAIMVDITPMLADVTPGNPIVLKINRCQNEDRLATKLTMDKMMRDMSGPHLNNPQMSNKRGRCIKCGQIVDLPIVNGKIQNICKECQIIDEHLKQKQEKEVIVELSDRDKRLIQSLSNEMDKKPIRKKRPTKPKSSGDSDAKDNV